MSSRKLRRRLGVGLGVTAGAGLLALTSIMHSAFAYGAASDVTAPDPAIGLVMGGSGLPIPGTEYVDAVNNLYIEPNFPGATFPGVLANGLFTPEGLYPLYGGNGVNTLQFNTSVTQGVTILNNNIEANIAAGDTSTVFGYSQSATISSLEMEALDPTNTPSDLPVQFVLIGDPSAPNGGLLQRFAGLDLASLGITFSGATPDNSFPTTIYTIEYDGFADFPEYPINLLADVNAFLGIYYLHGTYPDLTPAQVAKAFVLPTSGPTTTTYYLIPETNLPLLDPLRAIPVIGTPLADLLQPDLTVLVNLGYGPDNVGYSTPANVPTTFGLFPNVNLATVLSELAAGTQQGISQFMTDISSGALLASLSSLSDPSSATSSAASDPPTLTDIVNTLSSVASTAYATLLPTADIVNALLTSVPAYLFNVSLNSLQAGNLLDAVGLPIAGATGLLTLGAGFEIEVLASAVSTIIGDLTALANGDPPSGTSANAGVLASATGTTTTAAMEAVPTASTNAAVSTKAVPTASTNAGASAKTAPSASPNSAANTVTANTAKTVNTGPADPPGGIRANAGLPAKVTGTTTTAATGLTGGNGVTVGNGTKASGGQLSSALNLLKHGK